MSKQDHAVVVVVGWKVPLNGKFNPRSAGTPNLFQLHNCNLTPKITLAQVHNCNHNLVISLTEVHHNVVILLNQVHNCNHIIIITLAQVNNCNRILIFYEFYWILSTFRTKRHSEGCQIFSDPGRVCECHWHLASIHNKYCTSHHIFYNFELKGGCWCPMSSDPGGVC